MHENVAPNENWVVKFLTKERHTPHHIKQRLDGGVYGNLSPSYSTVKKWAKCFRLGQESLDDERPGRPIDVITPQNISIIEETELEDRRLKVKELAVMPC